jgi:hypothetical protein
MFIGASTASHIVAILHHLAKCIGIAAKESTVGVRGHNAGGFMYTNLEGGEVWGSMEDSKHLGSQTLALIGLWQVCRYSLSTMYQSPHQLFSISVALPVWCCHFE